MGTVLTAADVQRASVPTIPGTPASVLPNEMNQMKTTLVELTEFAKVVNNAIEKIAEMRGVKKDTATATAPGLAGSPAQIQSAKNTPAEVRVEKEIIEVAKNIDRELVKMLLYDLVIVQAEKLPDEWKNKKIGEVLGTNFKNVTFIPPGMEGLMEPLKSDAIITVLANNLSETIDKINRGEVQRPSPAVVAEEVTA